MLKDALVFIGNMHVRLNSWRQILRIPERSWCTYSCERIPVRRYLFPEQFHERIDSDDTHSTSTTSLINRKEKLVTIALLPTTKRWNWPHNRKEAEVELLLFKLQLSTRKAISTKAASVPLSHKVGFTRNLEGETLGCQLHTYCLITPGGSGKISSTAYIFYPTLDQYLR